MYKGYLKEGTAEVINLARTMAYIKNGLVAPGTFIDAPFGFDGLAEALGDDEYRTPALDAAPWFDPANPDTANFAGVIPLDFTGLDSTTRAVAVADRTGDGGTPSAPRRGPLTIAASALLLGRDGAAAAAGLQWLRTVLHRSCEPDADCAGTSLEGFLVCPTVGDLENDTAGLVDTPIPADGTWVPYDGAWDATLDQFTFTPPGVTDDTVVYDGGTPGVEPGPGLEASSGDTGAAVDGGDSLGTGTGTEDGGTPADPGTPTEDGGGPGVPSGPDIDPNDELLIVDGGGVTGGTVTYPDLPPTSRLALPEYLGCVSHVEVVWHVSPLASDSDQAVRVRVGAVDEGGNMLTADDEVILTANTTLTWSYDFVPWETWRPAIFASAPGIQITAPPVLRLHPLITPAECVLPYRRSFAQVVCVDGPNIVSEYQACEESGGSDLLQVEWTWVAADPYRYGADTNLVTGLPVTSNGAPTSETTHVGHTWVGTVTAAATLCAAPVNPTTCATDPSYPGFVAPPAAPVIIDPGITSPSSYVRQQISIEPQLVPDTGAAALRFTFVNNATIKRGVRVRLYHLPEGGGVPLECGFEDEFWINYIPASAVLVVDGITGQVTVECPDSTSANARRVMRGPYKGAFTFPTLRCGGAYLIRLDTPSGTGSMTVTLDAAPREG